MCDNTAGKVRIVLKKRLKNLKGNEFIQTIIDIYWQDYYNN